MTVSSTPQRSRRRSPARSPSRSRSSSRSRSRQVRESKEAIRARAVLIAAFSACIVLGLASVQRRNRLPAHVAAGDLALLGVATHKLARMVALDRITVPLRAPFAKPEARTGAGEVESNPRGRGLRRALGELVTCPYCLAPWTAGLFMLALIYAPRQTRVLAGLLNVVTVSDFLNQRYAQLKEEND